MSVRNGIRKVFESKIFYIVFSILASITIWLYVAYIENDDETVSVKGVKVEYLNEDYVSDRGLVITEKSTDTVTLRFTGKRSSVLRLSNQNVSVSVDLSEIKSKGVFQLTYEPTLPLEVNASSITLTSSTPTYIALTVDDLAQKEVQVKGTYGSVAEGYLADTMEITPGTITVFGPKEIVSQVDHAWVNVQRDNISKTVEEEHSFMLLDEEGHEVISDMLKLSQDSVMVVIPVVMLKELPLTVTLTPAAGADETTNTVFTISPPSITVSGDAEILEDMNKIKLGTIDLGSFLTTTTETFPIILPDGTNNLTGTTTANVTVSITGLESNHINATNIEVANVAEGYTATILTSSLDITLRGKKEELDQITERNVRVVADLSGLSETTGVFTVIAKVYVDGGFESVGAIGEYKVTVSVVKS